MLHAEYKDKHIHEATGKNKPCQNSCWAEEDLENIKHYKVTVNSTYFLITMNINDLKNDIKMQLD